ncbi:copper amine oxidase [Paenibacillus glucanolyticus]|uniref:Copper amine oxidase n=1 Tax=Paenibacillus glucanolyticus TaxID=59843 RepID=A0A163JHQ0_9BACL|nr:stalk domain-containing protein [Paenibacillus glucanolyticus]KZS46590.1 copper amine oxidase [Paenibacillus glucanolyticus]
MKTMKHTTTPLTRTLAAAGLAGILMISASGLPSSHVHAETRTAASTDQAETPAITPPLVTSKTLQSKEKWLETDIKIPVFQGLADTKYQEQLNDIIESHASKDMAKWEKEAAETAASAQKNGYTMRPYQLTITYELTSDGTDGDLISLKVITEGMGMNNGVPRVDTYNFRNEAEAQRVTLEDLFGRDYKAIVDQAVKTAIAADQENYFQHEDGFQGIDAGQAFYVSGGTAYIVFQKYSSAPGAAGMPEFAVKLPGQGQATEEQAAAAVMKSGVYYKDNNGKIMVPAAQVLRQLHFDVKWNGKNKTAEISKGAVWSAVTLNKDAYSFGKMAPRPLGSAPEMKGGHVYVPLAFLTDILHLQAKQDKHGDITVTAAQ